MVWTFQLHLKEALVLKGGKICQVEVAEMVSWRNWEIVTI